MRRSSFLLVLGLLSVGCGHRAAQEIKTPATAEAVAPDAWVLSTHDSSGGPPALLWNGLIGVRIARTGGGLDYEGKPLGFYMIDEYQKDGEEKILPMPNPLLVTWTVGNELFNSKNRDDHNFLKSGGTPLDPRQGSAYVQSLDMKTGILTTQWRQTVGDIHALVNCETAIHPTERVLAQRWTLACSEASPFAIKTLDYSGPNDVQESLGTDTAGTVSVSASPSRVVAMQTRLQGASSGALSRAGGFRIQEGTTVAGRPAVYERVLSFAPHSQSPLPRFTAGNMTQLKADTPRLYGFEDVAQASRDAWAKRWMTDIEIDGPVEDQQAVRSFLFYLRSSIAPKDTMSISPFGLSDDHYNGHVFWDADIWVFPALSFIDPGAASAIPAYRLAKARSAVSNFVDWFRAGASTASGPQRVAVKTNMSPAGIKFPWESSVTGKETCPGPSKFEEHITGSVLWSLSQAAALGLAPADKVNGLAAMASNTYLSMATQGGEKELSIKGVMSPDENHTGDDDLYTNLLAEWLANGRRWSPHPHPAFVMPRDNLSLLTYAGDKIKSYKQAATILGIYPLQYPVAEQEEKTMMDRFPPKVIKNGPAMSDSLNALIWARIGDERAYEAWQGSWKDYTQNPFLLFTEKRTVSNGYFTTGAAGSLQAVLYGFLGFRIDLQSLAGSVWSHKLLGGSVLSVKPHLPDRWKSIKLKNFSVLGATYTLTATHSGCSVKKGV